MFLSVVIPSYNEDSNISKGVLDQVYRFLKAKNYSWEIILADDGSSDGTLQSLKDFAKTKKEVRVLALPHRGKGPTVIDALLQATGEWRLFTDFDQATPISEIEKLLPETKKGNAIVIGSREIAGAQRKKEPFHRHWMGKVFNLCVQLIAIPGIHDTQCGFKLFSGQAVETLAPKVVVYSSKGKMRGAFTGAFDVELLYIAKKEKFSIAEVPIVWKYAKTDRVDPIKDSFRMFIDILRIRIADLQGQYN
jgi:glycosyltransferase involved in cell wall biosynthesis